MNHIQPRPDPVATPAPEAPPTKTPPVSAYRPFWWLRPFLIGLALGLGLLGMELLREMGKAKSDQTIKIMQGANKAQGTHPFTKLDKGDIPGAAGRFDAERLGPTWGLLLDFAQQIETAHSNDLAKGKLLEEMQKETAQWKGKKVAWKVPVERIRSAEKGAAEVLFQRMTSPVSMDEHMQASEEAALMDAYPRTKILFYELSLRSTPGEGGNAFFATPAENWLSNLQRGDQVRLEGTIGAVYYRQSGDLPIYEFQIGFSDYVLKPAR